MLKYFFSFYLFGLFMVGGLVLVTPSHMVQAAGPHCWCIHAGTCEHHSTVNDDGKTLFTCDNDPKLKTSCSQFCTSKGDGWRAINCDPQWKDHNQQGDPNCAKKGVCELPSENGNPFVRDRVRGQSCNANEDCEKMRVQACKEENDPNDKYCIDGVLNSCKFFQANSAPAKGGTAVKATTSTPSLYNPLGKSTTIQSLIARLIRAILGIVGALALLAFVWGGITWMTAGGNPKRVETGRTIIINATIGLLIIFFSYTLTNVFLQVISGAANNAQQTTNPKTPPTK